MSEISENLSEREIDFLKFQKQKGADSATAFQKLKIAQSLGKFAEVEEEVVVEAPEVTEEEPGLLAGLGRAAKEAITPLGTAIKGVAVGGVETVKGVVAGAEKIVGGTSQLLAESIGGALGLERREPGEIGALGLEVQEPINVSQAFSDVVTGGAQAGFSLGFPFTTVLIEGAGVDNPPAQAFLEFAAEKFKGLGEASLEGLESETINEFLGQLDETRRQEFEGLIGGLVLGGATKGAGVAVKGVKAVLPTQAAANKFVSTTLNLTPSQIKKIKKPNIAGEDPATYLLRKGIIEKSKNVEDVVNNLDDVVAASKTQVDKSLATITDNFKSESVVKGLEALKKEFDGVIGLEGELSEISSLLAKSQGQGLTLSEINIVKRKMDNALSMFTIAGDIKAGAVKQGLTKVRQDIKKFIEDEATNKGVTDIRALNKDVQVSNEIGKAIQDRLDAATKNRIFTLTDILVGGAGASIGLGVGAAVLVGKKIAESKRFKISLAKKLNKLPIEQTIGLQKKIESGTALSAIEKALIINAIVESGEELG